MNYNRVILGGRLTNKPELRTLPNGQSVADFGLATTEFYYDKNEQKIERTTFVDCNAFGHKADAICKFFDKGRTILVEGKLRLDKWETPEGDKRSKLYVVVDNFEFADGPKESNDAPPAEPPAKVEPKGRRRESAPF